MPKTCSSSCGGQNFLNHEKEYGKEITQKSFKELESIIKWFNIHGFHPIIIGGWAAYHFVQGIGSRDIDLILPKEALPALNAYCESHGFKLNNQPKTRILFSKKIGSQIIDLDVFTFDHKNKLAKNPKIEIPWSLSKNNCIDWKIGKNTARVPCIELLLLYKTAALIDRKYKAENWVLQPIQKQHLNAKIWKDKQDILQLQKQEINNKKLGQLLKKTKFKKEYINAINQM